MLLARLGSQTPQRRLTSVRHAAHLQLSTARPGTALRHSNFRHTRQRRSITCSTENGNGSSADDGAADADMPSEALSALDSM